MQRSYIPLIIKTYPTAVENPIAVGKHILVINVCHTSKASFVNTAFRFFLFSKKEKNGLGTKLMFDMLSQKHFGVADLSAVYIFAPNTAVNNSC